MSKLEQLAFFQFPDIKKCTRCEETKPRSEFYSHVRDGTRAECKECTNKDRARYRNGVPNVGTNFHHKQPELWRSLQQQSKVIEMETKLCSSCATVKPRSEFYADRRPSSSDGLRTECKECSKSRATTSRNAKNKEAPLTNKKTKSFVHTRQLTVMLRILAANLHVINPEEPNEALRLVSYDNGMSDQAVADVITAECPNLPPVKENQVEYRRKQGFGNLVVVETSTKDQREVTLRNDLGTLRKEFTAYCDEVDGQLLHARTEIEKLGELYNSLRGNRERYVYTPPPGKNISTPPME